MTQLLVTSFTASPQLKPPEQTGPVYRTHKSVHNSSYKRQWSTTRSGGAANTMATAK